MAQSELPNDAGTFLFTDIEGSTNLLHELGADATRRRSPRTAVSLTHRKGRWPVNLSLRHR